MLNIYVIWRQDEDDYFVTLLQYDNDDAQRQAMQNWSVQDYVTQAADVEYARENTRLESGASYDCITIFEAANVRFIF